MVIVWVVTDEFKSGYDAGGMFVGVIGRDYDITEEIID